MQPTFDLYKYASPVNELVDSGLTVDSDRAPFAFIPAMRELGPLMHTGDRLQLNDWFYAIRTN